MKRHARTAYKALQRMGVPVLSPELEWGGHFAISGEHEGGLDYDLDPLGDYGRGKEISEELRNHGLFFEWVNSGVAAVYDI